MALAYVLEASTRAAQRLIIVTNVVKFLQKGTRIKLVVQAQSQPDNVSSATLLTATPVRPVRPVARG